MNESKNLHAIRIYLLTNAATALSGLIELLKIPSDPKNAWLLGYSQTRLFGAAALFLIVGGFVILAIRFWYPEARTGRAVKAIQNHLGKLWLYDIYLALSTSLFAFSAIVAVRLRAYPEYEVNSSLIVRAFPFLNWITGFALTTALLLIFLRHNRNSGFSEVANWLNTVWDRKNNYLMESQEADAQQRLAKIQKPQRSILIIALLLIILWQYAFILNKGELDNSYRNSAFSAIKYNYSNFSYFYYYLDLFPLTSTLFHKEEYIPTQYLGQEAAQAIIDNRPDTLRMDGNFRTRVGNLGKIWLFIPEAIVTGSPSSLSVHAFLSVLFIFGLLALLVSSWRISLFPLGALIVLFVGSHPFQLWELYANPGKDANMGNLFSLNITVAIIALAFFLPIIFNRKVSNRYLWRLMIASGVAAGTLLQVRTEPIMILATCFLAVLLFAQIDVKKRGLLVVFSLAIFAITASSWSAYFDAKWEKTYQIVKKAGGPALPKLNSYHGLWHSLLVGLGDFDDKYGMKWSDIVAHAIIVPKMEADGLLEKVRLSGDPEFYKNPVDILPEYQQYARAEFLNLVRNDPGWYLTILLKRSYRIFVDVVPVNIAAAGRSFTFMPRGFHIFLIVAIVALFKKWSYLKLMMFVFPLSITALTIYSGGGIAYYSIMLQIGIAILLYLLGLALLVKRSV